MFAAVKANGYGHGLGLAARAFANAVDGLGVAVIEEAQALRHLGLAHPVLVAQGSSTPTSWPSPRGCTRKWWCTHPGRWTCWRRGRPRWVWIKVNTGMNRLGMAPDLARNRRRACAPSPGCGCSA